MAHFQNGSVWDLRNLLEDLPFAVDLDAISIWDKLLNSRWDVRDTKSWKLTGNRFYSVKSFYCFLNDGGLRCLISKFLW